VNADVDALFQTKIIKTAIKFSLINDGNVEFGFSIGANITFLTASLSSIMLDQEETIDEVAPLPLIGGHLALTLSPGFFLKGDFQFFSLALEKFDGSAMDFRAVVEYYPFKNIGVGAGMNMFKFNLDVSEEDFLGKADYSYSGLVCYLSLVL
jgi:hypothetical protein